MGENLMSRTKRKTFYDYQPSRRDSSIENWTGYRGKTIERDRYLNGRDGVSGYYGEPCSKSPNGYNRWNDRDGNSSRWCKRGAAKVIRNRYKKMIREELRIIDAVDDEVIYRNRPNGEKLSRKESWNRWEKKFNSRFHTNHPKEDTVSIRNIKIEISLLKKTQVAKSLKDSINNEIEFYENELTKLRLKS